MQGWSLVEEDRVEQAAELVDGQVDEVVGCRCVVAFDRGGDGEEGVGEHREGGPAVPGIPAADLVLVEPDQAFGRLEGLLDAPALSGDADQLGQRGRPGRPAAQVGKLAGGAGAANEQMVLTPARSSSCSPGSGRIATQAQA